MSASKTFADLAAAVPEIGSLLKRWIKNAWPDANPVEVWENTLPAPLSERFIRETCERIVPCLCEDVDAIYYDGKARRQERAVEALVESQFLIERIVQFATSAGMNVSIHDVPRPGFGAYRTEMQICTTARAYAGTPT